MNERHAIRHRITPPRRRSITALAFVLATVTTGANALAADPSGEHDDDASPMLVDEGLVVKTAIAQNPTLAAALVEVRRAELSEEAEEHRYSFVLQLDGGATRAVTPNAAFASAGLTFPESTAFTTGGELRKHLVWGTDLSLRMEGSLQRSLNTFTNVATNPPMVTQLTVGPNWGALVRLSVTQPLLRGAGRDVNEALLQQARVNRTAAMVARDQSASELLVSALTAYWELYYASRAREIQEQSLSLARAQLEDTDKRVRTGSIAPVEALSFETRIATLEEDLAKAEAEERDRATELARQLGDETLRARRADTRRELGDMPIAGAELRAADARALALTASYEVRAQEEAVHLAEVQARSAADALRPRLDVEGYVQAQGLGQKALGPAFEQIGSLRAVSMYLGLTYELPLDSTQRRNEKERADLVGTSAREKLEAVKQRVAADLDVAMRKEATARRRIELAEQSLAIATRQLEAESARFKTGSSTALLVREAEDQVRNAQLRRVRAEVDRTTAEAQVAHLTGRLLGRRTTPT